MCDGQSNDECGKSKPTWILRRSEDKDAKSWEIVESKPCDSPEDASCVEIKISRRDDGASPLIVSKSGVEPVTRFPAYLGGDSVLAFD
ncbi:MAG TPA: hypothetical protein PLA80_12610, partial [Synergistaceae bacterium]|nr:hypothetical protein [Synergistaceae bacterium]